MSRCTGTAFLRVERALDASETSIEDVGVDHGRADVFVSDELLDGSDVVAALEEKRPMSGHAVRSNAAP